MGRGYVAVGFTAIAAIVAVMAASGRGRRGGRRRDILDEGNGRL